MRSNLLGMCSAVAAVAVAGSASAGVVIFDFTTNVTSPAEGVVNGSNPFNNWGTGNARESTTTSASTSGGAITIANNEWAIVTPPPRGSFYVYANTSVNLSGITAIEFNVTAHSGAAADWTLSVLDKNFNGQEFYLRNTSGTGTKSFSTLGGNPNLDWSKVYAIDLQIVTTDNGPGSPRFPASSFTFNGMTAVAAVPAPGAAALIGVVGLINTRRRRN
jgi:hypothetical protein